MRKFLPYILILVILAGLVNPPAKAHAQAGPGTCSIVLPMPNPTEPDCRSAGGTWTPTTPASGLPGTCSIAPITTEPACISAGGTWTPTTSTSNNGAELINYLPKCGVIVTGTLEGCLIKVSYYIFFALPAMILALTANLFNSMLSITLSSMLYTSSTFIPEAWRVVRDFSNIFFILILLYIAFKVILGLGGTDVKKMIVHVVLVALLINFSMFFTKIVIDSSNILALIFYNKINVTGPTSPPVFNSIKTGVPEKDFGGGIVAGFNPTRLMSADMFPAQIKESSFLATIWCAASRADLQNVAGCLETYLASTTGGGTATTFYLSIIFVSGAIFLFASYAFIVAAFSFLGRLIELWVLIIFSPFAFMSFAIPQLKGADYIGWDSWSKRLISVSFMAPIFMFFLYLISKLTEVPFWTDLQNPNQGIIARLLLIIIPSAIILTLLLKAAEYAKKGSGKFGDVVVNGAKMLGGFALMGATGGTAMALRAGVGGGGGWAASKLATGFNKMGASDKFGGLARKLGANKIASGLTGVGAYVQKKSFDVRATGLGKVFSSATGLKMGEAQKGGIAQSRKEKVEKRMKRAELLNLREDEGLKQKLNKTEADLQALLSANAEVMDTLDKTIEKKRQEANDANTRLNAARGTAGEAAAQADLADKNTQLRMAKENKTDFRAGRDYITTNSAGVDTYNTGTGTNIDAMEEKKKDQARAIKTESRRRKVALANRGARLGRWNSTANKEAKHKIIMESKIESKGEAH